MANDTIPRLDFGKKLASLRKRKGLTQQQLAERLKIKPHTVSYYERSAKNPSMDVLHRCAEALEVTVLDLLPEGPTPRLLVRRGPEGDLERLLAAILQLHPKQRTMVIRTCWGLIKGLQG